MKPMLLALHARGKKHVAAHAAPPSAPPQMMVTPHSALVGHAIHMTILWRLYRDQAVAAGHHKLVRIPQSFVGMRDPLDSLPSAILPSLIGAGRTHDGAASNGGGRDFGCGSNAAGSLEGPPLGMASSSVLVRAQATHCHQH